MIIDMKNLTEKDKELIRECNRQAKASAQAFVDEIDENSPFIISVVAVKTE